MRRFVFLMGAAMLVASSASVASVMSDYDGSVRQFLATSGGFAAPQPSSVGGTRMPGYSFFALGHLTPPAARLENDEPSPTTDGGEEQPRMSRRKSPVRAFFLSLLLPGLGEMYTGHRIRGAVFLALEATGWGLWSHYRGKGKDWEDKYIAFQEEHWSFERYDAYRHAVWDRAGEQGNLWDPSRPLAERQQDSLTVLVGTHHYDACCGEQTPDEGDQLEVIGKYFRFSYGWDDAALGGDGPPFSVDENAVLGGSAQFPFDINNEWGLDKDQWKTALGGALVTPLFDDSTYAYQVPYLNLVRSQNRETYMEWRKNSNDAFGISRKMVTAILFNHIVSAIHAARLAKAYNEDLTLEAPRTHLRMVIEQTERDVVPMLVVWRRF